MHGVVCLVDQVQHAEARHAQCVHGEHAAGHLRGDGVEVAALEQDVDDRHGKGGKQRRERQDNKQRVFYRAADIALVLLRVYLRIGQIVFREQHNADAVDKRRCDRREELVRVVHGAHSTAAECRHGIGVCQIAQQEDGRGKHCHDRRAGEELEIGITEVQPGDEPEFFAHDTRDRHGKLQQPRKADDQHIFEHALAAGKQHEKHDQQQIVWQAQTALQRIVLHGLEYGDQQVDDHDQRQRQQADLQICPQGRQVGVAHAEPVADGGEADQHREQHDDQRTHEHTHADQVPGYGEGLVPVLGKVARDHGDGRNAKRVGDGREDVDRIVIGDRIEIKGRLRAEYAGLQRLADDAEDLGQQCDCNDQPDGAQGALVLILTHDADAPSSHGAAPARTVRQ